MRAKAYAILAASACLALSAVAALPCRAEPRPNDDECLGRIIPVDREALGGLRTAFFKRWAMYTRGGKYDPTQDLVHFMALNFYQGNGLSPQEYSRMEQLLGEVPGDGPLAPTIEQLLPHMWSYLASLKANTSGRAAAEASAASLMREAKPLLSEALGGNRVLYAAVEDEVQKVVRIEGAEYLVSLEGCPGRLTLLDMSGYTRFASLAEERADLRSRLGRGDMPAFLQFLRRNLDDRSHFKRRLGVLIETGS